MPTTARLVSFSQRGETRIGDKEAQQCEDTGGAQPQRQHDRGEGDEKGHWEGEGERRGRGLLLL